MAEPAGRSGGAPWIMLGMLFLAYSCSAIDRLVISLLVEPIKADLDLSDTQISLLQGFAFLLMYSLAAIPAGYLVDRVNRTRLIAAGVTFWSLMTSACGLASHYGTLFLARAGVGIGEATLSPASYSLISDSFPRNRHGLAIGIYSCGATVGAGLAFIIGGYVVGAIASHGEVSLPLIGPVAAWQMTFLVLGIPGLIIAAMIALLAEPQRTSGRRDAAGRLLADGSVRDFLRMNRKTLACHHAAVGLSNVIMTATAAWVAVFLMRVHGWEIAEVGAAVGIAKITGGLIGLLGGGALSDYLFRFGAHMRLWLCACAALIGAGAAAAFPLLSDPLWAVILFSVVIMCGGMPFGVANAALQHLTPSRMRGVVSAIFFFTISMIGALGPSVVAVVTDGFFPSEHGIRYSMAIVIPAAFIASFVLYVVTVPLYVKSLRLWDSGEAGSGSEPATQWDRLAEPQPHPRGISP